jgi:hypothetical protein
MGSCGDPNTAPGRVGLAPLLTAAEKVAYFNLLSTVQVQTPPDTLRLTSAEIAQAIVAAADSQETDTDRLPAWLNKNVYLND